MGSLLFMALGLTAAKQIPPGEVLWQEGVSYRAEGRQLQEAGELERATMAYRHAVMVSPHYAEAYNDLGVALESGGDKVRAEEAYKAALRLKPELAAAHSNLALFYEESGRLPEAAEHWAARVRVGAPTDPWVIRAREKLVKYQLPVPESAERLAPHRVTVVQKAIKEHDARTNLETKASISRVQREAEDLRKAEWAQKAEAERRARAAKKTVSMVPAPPATASVPNAAKAVAEEYARGKTVSTVPVPPATASVPSAAKAVAEEYAREKARTRQATARELYDRAQTAMREQRYRDAVDQFKQISVLDPSNRDAQRGLERAEKALAKQLH